MDSAAEIYGFALDHMKVDRAGVEGAAALRRASLKMPAAWLRSSRALPVSVTLNRRSLP